MPDVPDTTIIALYSTIFLALGIGIKGFFEYITGRGQIDLEIRRSNLEDDALIRAQVKRLQADNDRQRELINRQSERIEKLENRVTELDDILAKRDEEIKRVTQELIACIEKNGHIEKEQ